MMDSEISTTMEWYFAAFHSQHDNVSWGAVEIGSWQRDILPHCTVVDKGHHFTTMSNSIVIGGWLRDNFATFYWRAYRAIFYNEGQPLVQSSHRLRFKCVCVCARALVMADGRWTCLWWCSQRVSSTYKLISTQALEDWKLHRVMCISLPIPPKERNCTAPSHSHGLPLNRAAE